MNGLLLGLLLGQATVGVHVSVTVARPTCVVVDDAGVARVVRGRALRAAQRRVACTTSPEAGTPRVRQQVLVAGTADAPEQRLIEIDY